MVTLDSIMDNISQYRGDIASLVSQLKSLGIYSLDEFKARVREAGGAPIPRDIQEGLAAKFLNSDDDDWQAVKMENTVEAYQRYMDAHPDGKYREDARNAKKALSEAVEVKKSSGVWETLDKNNIDALKLFVQQFPNDPHVIEANSLLRELRKEKLLGVDIKALEIQMKEIEADKTNVNPQNVIFSKIEKYLHDGKITKEQLVDAIREDHNFISSKVAYMLWDKGMMTEDDFAEADIDRSFITCMLSNRQPMKFSIPERLTKVTKVPCTEIYFWGIPSSGKTCALGAILSASGAGRYAQSMAKDNDCQGYGYMNKLAYLFKSDNQVCALPEGTPTTSTYEMGFDLEDKDGKVHPITCVDLAGELVRCMYKKDAGEMLTNEEDDVLATLTNVLVDNRTKNRKIHFFVLEYGAENREYDGLPQSTYLDAAVRYIERTGIFKNDTDGLYLLITKVDKAKAKGQELHQRLEEYVSTKYLGFYNGIKKICRDNEINGGKVTVMPFTLGDVCFQDYCLYKEKAASKVVLEIISRSFGEKPGKLSKFIAKMKK